jgi:lysozyme
MRKIMIVGIASVLAVLLMTVASPSPASAASPSYYIVRPGDTLFSIATRYGLSSWTLAQANGIWNPNYIYVGQTLVIPGSIPYPCPGCPVPQPVPNPRPMPGPIYNCSYHVQYGDTMSAIAARLRTDVWTLARYNGIYNLNWIYAGQWLRIPGCYL